MLQVNVRGNPGTVYLFHRYVHSVVLNE